ncbi:unnamed protein product [Didymodactylos carnosus]|uniref:Uncharacterized protein n=1 Tax=Didymodactylos carnosus TaxID=1234261 RepID=A0A815QNW4_9BILA|nr:unnamed protein product [Didymodactylos carnosus]CAF1465685.1 unnamed protein product [Didymodactylos carnosus]CAF4217199.1 unnamed protein product [Didymodactylos carnosus]CAF4334867.1 unnamed protein product [Didymodactylos carnosus]
MYTDPKTLPKDIKNKLRETNVDPSKYIEKLHEWQQNALEKCGKATAHAKHILVELIQLWASDKGINPDASILNHQEWQTIQHEIDNWQDGHATKLLLHVRETVFKRVKTSKMKADRNTLITRLDAQHFTKVEQERINLYMNLHIKMQEVITEVEKLEARTRMKAPPSLKRLGISVETSLPLVTAELTTIQNEWDTAILSAKTTLQKCLLALKKLAHTKIDEQMNKMWNDEEIIPEHCSALSTKIVEIDERLATFDRTISIHFLLSKHSKAAND